jgi:RNA polymerase sigma-70 factor (ECF subfamily)
MPNNLMTGVTASTESPLEGMVKVETFGIIRQLMEELPQGDRDILTLRYALDYEAPQIAETLGIAPTAVHMRLSRARQRLAELLAAQGIEKRS